MYKLTFYLNAVVLLFQFDPRLKISQTTVLLLLQDDLQANLLPY